jgi:ABC-type antimicrobial peptide transport system permease subunit
MADGAKPDAHELEKVAASIDPTQPIYDVQTLEQSLSDSIAPLFLMGIIPGIALLMALVGIHGVVAYSVAQRTREIGLRMALGATRPDVLLMIYQSHPWCRPHGRLDWHLRSISFESVHAEPAL